MNRKDFIKYLAMLPLAGATMSLKELGNLTSTLKTSSKMPVLFLGHGSPMNAIEENEFVEEFRSLQHKIPTPQVIICVSAHWETKGTKITAMEKPKTIHDFGGFPKALFEVQYPAPGSPEVANEVVDSIHATKIELDHEWGLDHGSWSVIKHIYPEANIPVLELSIDYTQPAAYHYALAKELSVLRNKGVLFIGSGNIVHNLRKVAWDKLMTDESYGYDWALEANDSMVKNILSRQHDPLINFRNQSLAYQLSIPTPEHYIPLLYTLGMMDSKDNIDIFNNKAIGGSLTMTSVRLFT